MIKRILMAVGIVAAAIAMAQVDGRVVGAAGRGVASNGNGRNGHFAFEVKKGVRAGNPNPVLSGRFEWNEISEVPEHRFSIVMGRLANLGVNIENHVAEFNGPAKLRRMSATGPVAIEGRLNVRVVDRRRPENSTGGTTEPDLIMWQFISPATNVDLRFEGFVREGDLRVFARSSGGGNDVIGDKSDGK